MLIEPNPVITQEPTGQQIGSKWLPFFWFSALLLASYAVVLAKLANQWMSDPDMTHGMFVPVLVGYIVWERRDILSSVKGSPSVVGILLMLGGAFLLCIGPPGLDTFAAVTRVAFL